MVKNVPTNAGDTGLIPGSGRSPGVGNDNILQYCMGYFHGNPMDRGAWQATVHGGHKEPDMTWQLNNSFQVVRGDINQEAGWSLKKEQLLTFLKHSVPLCDLVISPSFFLQLNFCMCVWASEDSKTYGHPFFFTFNVFFQVVLSYSG